MIEQITTLKQMAALEAAVKAASQKAMQLKDTDDNGTCNFDACIIKIKIPKRLRDASSLKLSQCSYGVFRGWYFIYDLPLYGQANMRTRMAEAAADSLCEAGYNAHVYYAMD